MRFTFVAGMLLLVVFELANVYLIMPMPGAQRMRSLELAYLLYSWRWAARAIAAMLVLSGLRYTWAGGPRRRGLMAISVLAAGAISYQVNFVMSAEAMFRQPTVVTMATPPTNSVALDRLVVGVEVNGEARAYPLQFIGYHHQVRDAIGGREVLVTYCTVCRTGRVFDPTVDGVTERFRLVGMDQFNAMLEDRTTGSWWRQANGEAVAGPRSGTVLVELPSRQLTLRQWLALYPASQIMQGDPLFTAEYAQDYAYERGTSRSRLTGTDPRSWEDKSWVVGLKMGRATRAYDWNQLLQAGAINDTLDGRPVLLVVAADSASFYAFVRHSADARFVVDGDSIRTNDRAYAFNGKGPTGALQAMVASQEFWHSWRTFNPGTTRHE